MTLYETSCSHPLTAPPQVSIILGPVFIIALFSFLISCIICISVCVQAHALFLTLYNLAEYNLFI